jgi:hypothetical protein
LKIATSRDGSVRPRRARPARRTRPSRRGHGSPTAATGSSRSPIIFKIAPTARSSAPAAIPIHRVVRPHTVAIRAAGMARSCAAACGDTSRPSVNACAFGQPFPRPPGKAARADAPPASHPAMRDQPKDRRRHPARGRGRTPSEAGCGRGPSAIAGRPGESGRECRANHQVADLRFPIARPGMTASRPASVPCRCAPRWNRRRACLQARPRSRAPAEHSPSRRG